MRKDLNILITGASRGIGNAIMNTIHNRASNLFLTSKNKDILSKSILDLKNSFDGNLYGLSIDQSEGVQSAKKVANWIEEKVENIDILILCAGNFFEGELCTMKIDDFNNTLETNFLFNYFAVRELLPLLKKSSFGRVLFIGSTAAYSSYSVPSYSVSKWALRGLATNLRKELSKENIGITFISPGSTLTDMWSDVDIPENRLLDPMDIAKIIECTLDLSGQAVVEELIVTPMLGDYDE